jgi:hypothetical protein
MHHVKNVKELPLVLMDALYLNVIQCINWD